MSVLFTRLFYLTVVEGEQYRKLGQENRIRESIVYAPRGILYDRYQTALVRNIPMFKNSDGRVYFEHPPQEGEVKETVTRDFVFGRVFAHVIGYTAEVTEEDLKEDTALIYTLGDFIGKMGLEQSRDRILRGINGKELIEVDARGEKIRTLGRVNPVNGANIYLTIDAGLQTAVSEALSGVRGAVVASSPGTGEVFAIYSSPSFDPNLFVRNGDVESLFSDPEQTLFDRAISGQYPPGSTFKIITAVAGLESRSITRETKIEDTGVLQVGRFSYANWYFSSYGKKEGALDIVAALRRSNDIYFYKAGEATGIETLSGWARNFGAGSATGIEIYGESSGLMPDPNWRKKEKNENWYLGNTYHVAIGQGDVLATPLQVNSWTNVIANGGKLCKPILVYDTAGRTKTIKTECKDLEISPETLRLVKEGMKQACQPGGTGWPLFKFRIMNSELRIDNVDYFEANEATGSGKSLVEIPVACKTGTAEFGDPEGKTHAWITAFAPVEHPQISVTVLVEEGGEGSSVAGPIAQKILETWFNRGVKL